MSATAEDRIRRLFLAHAPTVADFLARRVDRELDLDEMVDETFVIVWRRIDEVPKESELPWILGVARNVAHNARRAHQRRIHYEHQVRRGARSVGTTPEDEVITDYAGKEALSRLSSTDRELLRLHAWEGLEPREIAVVLGITANAAATRLSRAKARFLSSLSEGANDGTNGRPPHI